MFRPRFTRADVERIFQKKLERLEELIINRLTLVGERFVRNARLNGSYLDHTGNLRSSIGYVIIKNGNVIRDNFQEAGAGTDRGTGLSAAKTLAQEIQDRYTRGYVLVVFAGMNYAAAVESKGKDVLTGSAAQAKNDLQRAINQIKRKLKENQ